MTSTFLKAKKPTRASLLQPAIFKIRYSLIAPLIPLFAKISSADIASVTISEADAKSISPAVARLSTVGNVSHICCVSYPASAR